MTPPRVADDARPRVGGALLTPGTGWPQKLATFAPAGLVAALWLSVAADGPTALRLALAIVVCTYGVGAPIVGLLRLPPSAARTALVCGTSLAVSVIVAGTLVLARALTATTASTALAVLITGTSAAVARRRPTQPAAATVAEADPAEDVGPGPLSDGAAPGRAARSTTLWALTGGAAALWLAAALLVDPRAAGDLGMVSALPLVWWGGSATLVAALLLHLRLGISGRLALLQTGLLVAYLYGIMAVAQPFSRIPTTYTHVGLVDYIVRDHEISSFFDGRYSWPGSLSIGAMITQLAGASTSAEVVRWAIPAFVCLWALGVFAIASAYSDSRRVPWLATWTFLALNWVSQDYWSAQALNFLLFLVAVSTVATWFPRRTRRGDTPALLPAGPVGAPDGPGPPDLGGGQRIGLFLLLGLLAIAVAASHQLSPFMVVGALAVLWLVDRRDIHPLPLVAATVTIVWLSWGAQAYWVSHLSRLTRDVGDVGAVVASGTAGRVADRAADGRRVVLGVRMALSAAAWIGAAAAVFRLRRRRGMIALGALVVMPFGAVTMQQYGGELFLRIFLFSLPFVAVALAVAAEAALVRHWRRPRAAGATAVVACVILLAGFVVARHGNERFEQIYAEDVAATRFFYDVAPPGAHAVGTNTSNPFRMGPYNDYEPRRVSELSQPDTTDVAASLSRTGFDHGFVLIYESSIAEAELRFGSRPGWSAELREELAQLGAELRFEQRRAAVYEYSLEEVEPAPEAVREPVSRARESVRRALGQPALALALAGVLFITVLGAFRVGGWTRPSSVPGGADLGMAVAVAAIVALMIARFSALT